MMKIYTNDINTSQTTVNTPDRVTLDNILNFSKSLEVLKMEKDVKSEMKNVEVILN